MGLTAILGIAKAAGSYWQYAVMAVLLVGVLWYRGQYHDLRADQAAAIIEAQQKADELSAKLAAEQAKKQEVIEKKVIEYRTRIRSAPDDAAKNKLGTQAVRDILGGGK